MSPLPVSARWLILSAPAADWAGSVATDELVAAAQAENNRKTSLCTSEPAETETQETASVTVRSRKQRGWGLNNSSCASTDRNARITKPIELHACWDRGKSSEIPGLFLKMSALQPASHCSTCFSKCKSKQERFRESLKTYAARISKTDDSLGNLEWRNDGAGWCASNWATKQEETDKVYRNLVTLLIHLRDKNPHHPRQG